LYVPCDVHLVHFILGHPFYPDFVHECTLSYFTLHLSVSTFYFLLYR